MNKISILLPTRGRFELFKSSVESLYSRCQNTDNFEILVALDNDDLETIYDITNYIEDVDNIKVFTIDRQTYKNLNVYYDILSNKSTGDSLMLWNDDAIMESNNWDYEILKNHNKFYILNPKVSNMENYWSTVGVLFPIIPKKWFDLTGRWSYIQACDSWVDILSKRLGLLQNLDSVIIRHDRHDLTGNNLDFTYTEGRNHVGINKSGWEKEVDIDYEILLRYVNELNQDFTSTWGKNPNYCK